MGASLALGVTPHGARAAERIGTPLAPWTPGMLDIHHISTGRGSSALIIGPDGTSAMVDAGAIYESLEFTISPKPDGSRRPGEWLGRYAKRHLRAIGSREIDYFILSHFHGDHMGAVNADLPLAPGGAYRLTGVSDVAQILPIRCFIDRNYPDYAYPLPIIDTDQQNYRAFIEEARKSGKTIERFAVGSKDQIRLLRKPAAFPDFAVRNLAANGEIWTGITDGTRQLYPDLKQVPGNYPTENMCSVALRLNYGLFSYYTGGDLTSSNNFGDDPWRDIETPVARIAGKVDVAVVNHHGYADAAGPGFMRALRPKAMIIQAWDSAHPVVSTLANMTSTRLYPDARDIYATAMKEENRIANRGLAKLASQNGHVVVRVAPGGRSFHIIVTDNGDEQDRVVSVHGPFSSG